MVTLVYWALWVMVWVMLAKAFLRASGVVAE